jgi:biotin synthase-like enzyme
MNRNYHNRIAASKARQETELLAAARRFADRGAAAFVEIARARHNAPITLEYAQELIARATGGKPNPLP